MTAEIIPLHSKNNAGVGLTDQECYIVGQATLRLPGLWHVQYDEDSSGHGSVALLPDDHNGLSDRMPVLLIWRDNGRLHLGLGQGDFYAGLGTHANIEILMCMVEQTLIGSEMVDQWISCELVQARPIQ